MRRLIPLLLTLGLLAVACQAPNPSPTPTPLPTADPSQPLDRALFRDGLVEASQPILDGLPGASEYRLELEIADDLLHVTGQEILRYTNNENLPLDEVRLRLFPNLLGGDMRVTNLRVDGVSVTPQLSLNDSLLTAPLPAPLAPGQSTQLSMDFSVT
ncbi:MAG: hypothetical protein ACOY0R_00025, partial [Chloroflexota bacterium]